MEETFIILKSCWWGPHGSFESFPRLHPQFFDCKLSAYGLGSTALKYINPYVKKRIQEVIMRKQVVLKK